MIIITNWGESEGPGESDGKQERAGMPGEEARWRGGACVLVGPVGLVVILGMSADVLTSVVPSARGGQHYLFHPVSPCSLAPAMQMKSV